MTEGNIMEHIGSDGKFADTFKAQIPAIAGKEFKESKIFDDVPDITTLVKNYAKTKQDYGRKLEGVIQKPGDKATDTEKAEYVASLRKELGAPDSADAYEISRPDDLPEGMGFDEDAEKEFREFFMSRGVPVETVKDLTEMFSAWQIRRFNAHLEEEQKVFETNSKAVQTKFKGNALVKAGREVYAAIMEFGTSEKDVENTEEKALTVLLKESKIYEDAANLEKWRNLGVSPMQFLILQNMGNKMKSSEHISDEGGAGGGSEKTDREKKMASIYDHPSSQRTREERARVKE